MKHLAFDELDIFPGIYKLRTMALENGGVVAVSLRLGLGKRHDKQHWECRD